MSTTTSIRNIFHPNKSKRIGIVAIAGLIVLGQIQLFAAGPDKKEAPPVPKMRKADLKPLSDAQKPVSAHSPFQDADCSLCHERKDAKDPGLIRKPVNELCLECHDDFAKIMSRKFVHAPARVNCVSCHNPHNSHQPKLLVEESGALCLACHTSMGKLMAAAPVKHDALTTGAKCMNCHNPHATAVEHLLNRLPFDLCVNCHGKDDIKDENGKVLANMKKLLAANPNQHGPVDSKDCSACHAPHGGENFRLLTKPYPAEFYAPYDSKIYALCFDCHEDTVAKDPKTTTLTKFRNGDQNLHYLHVNKDERGRTCRACHEVHASQQKHQIRDAVPYGRNNYMLKVNFTQTPTGGTCDRTCHSAKSYTNSVVPLAPKPADKPADATPPKTP